MARLGNAKRSVVCSVGSPFEYILASPAAASAKLARQRAVAYSQGSTTHSLCAMANLVPSEIILATAHGDAATVRSWLESGGDANQELPDNYRWIIDQGDRFEDSDDEENISGQRLLAVATEHDHCDLIRILVAHGAELDHEFYICGD